LFQQSPALLFELLENPPDQRLYERLFDEALLYFYRNRDRFSDWQAVVVYPSRSLEQSQIKPYRALLESDKVHRVYLNELGAIEQLPLGVALMVLTTFQESQAAVEARNLLVRSQQEISAETSRAMIEMVTTIMVYKFTNLSRREVEAMLGITLQQTRVYQEAKEEGRQEGEHSLISLQLQQKLGKLPSPLRERIAQLNLTQLEALAISLLSFSTLADLEAWLESHQG
jgi:predicted transposase YdaD